MSTLSGPFDKVNKMFPEDLQAVIEWSLLNYRAGVIHRDLKPSPYVVSWL